MYTFAAWLGQLACSLMLEWARDKRPCSNYKTFPLRRWWNWHTLCPWIESCLRAGLCWIRMCPEEGEFQNNSLNHYHVILVYLLDVGDVEILGNTLEDFLSLERSYLRVSSKNVSPSSSKKCLAFFLNSTDRGTLLISVWNANAACSILVQRG